MTAYTDTSVRLAAVLEFTELLRLEVERKVDRPERVGITPHDPGDALRREHLYIVDVEGDVTDDGLAGGTDAPTEDGFTIAVVARVELEGGDGVAAMRRADELYRAVRRVAHADEHGSTLGELTVEGHPVISHTLIGNVDGPLCGPSDTGMLCLFRIDVDVTTDEVDP